MITSARQGDDDDEKRESHKATLRRRERNLIFGADTKSTVKCWMEVKGRLCTDICAYIIKRLSNLRETCL